MMVYKRLLALFSHLLVWTFIGLEARSLPQLSTEDVLKTTNHILLTHADFHKLEPELAKRILANYLEELDPVKTYFIASDIQSWTDPSPELLQNMIEEYSQGSFTVFKEINLAMCLAIERRHILEAESASTPLPTGVSAKEFQKMEWSHTEEELSSRLLRIRALQMDALNKLSENDKNQALQRLAKRRHSMEEELLNTEMTLPHIHTHVLKATASALDAHTIYFTPAEASQFIIQMQQRLFGIGVQIRDDLNGFSVVKIIEGSPAAEEKLLKAQDKIIAINGEPIVGLDIEEVVEMIRGPENTKVQLTILREEGETEKIEKRLEIAAMRKEIIIKEARFDCTTEPYGDGVIGHLKLYSFYQDPANSSGSDLRQAINDLKSKYKLKGIILDLRYNTGGLLPQAVEVTGLFINKGIVVSIKENDGSIQHLRDFEGNPVWDGALLVLISRNSASGSEIVAQTLQDYGRAIVVGDSNSYGKGTYQTFSLDSTQSHSANQLGEYKVTRGRYYTVSGKSPQLVGVKADIDIPGPLFYTELGEKYSKYPLENDSIEPHFEDNLEDIPFSKRKKISWLYKFNLQQKLSQYTQYLTQLQQNSAMRIENSKAYQLYLKELEKNRFDYEEADLYAQIDFQYQESVQVMKDLLALMQ